MKNKGSQLSPEKPAKKARPSSVQRMQMIIANVNGGGIRVVVDKPDMRDTYSIVNNILRAPDPNSGYHKKFTGIKHEESIVIDGKNYGHYSYKWNKGDDQDSGFTAQVLAELFKKCRQFKLHAGEYAKGNIKCDIKIMNNGKPVPMETFFCDEDIQIHCKSNEARYIQWRNTYNPLAQDQKFFWKGKHCSLQALLDDYSDPHESPELDDGFCI